MAKFKKKRPAGLTARRNLITIDNVPEAQENNRALMLSYVQPGDIEQYYAKLREEAIVKGKPWAMRLFAEQVLGPVKTESRQEVVDIAKILEVATGLQAQTIDAEPYDEDLV